jgi:hypothetical protein
MVIVFFIIGAKGLALAEGRGFRSTFCQAKINVYSEPKSFFNHDRPAFATRLLAAVFSF